MTSVSINEIIEIERLSNNKSEEFVLLEISVNEAIKLIKKFKQESSLQQIIESFTIIRASIKEFRDEIYLRFSSNPTEIINNMINNFEKTEKK